MSLTSQETFSNLQASSLAALCSRLATHPLDTIKTRIQVSEPRPNTQHPSLRQTLSALLQPYSKGYHPSRPKGAWPRLASSLSSLSLPFLASPSPLPSTAVSLGSWSGLYRGLPIALVFSVPGLSVYLTAYDSTKQYLSRLQSSPSWLASDSIWNHLFSASVAEVSSGVFWTPMEVIKSKQQVESVQRPQDRTSCTKRTHTSTVSLARQIYQREGIKGFYRGYFITLAVFVPYSMIYFATYEQLKASAARSLDIVTMKPNVGLQTDETQALQHLPFAAIVGCAAVSSGVAASVSNIVDVVKTRWQVSVLAAPVAHQSSTFKIAQHMFQNGGIWSFTKGMGARVMWMMPSVTISMSVFEYLKSTSSF